MTPASHTVLSYLMDWFLTVDDDYGPVGVHFGVTDVCPDTIEQGIHLVTRHA